MDDKIDKLANAVFELGWSFRAIMERLDMSDMKEEQEAIDRAIDIARELMDSE